MVGLAYAILFKNLFRFHDGDLIKILGSVDGAYFQILGYFFFVFIFIMYAAIIWLTWRDKKHLLKWATYGLFITFYLVGIPNYYKEIISYQNFQYLADSIIEIHRSGDCNLSNTIQILTPPGTPDRDQALMFNTIYFNNYEGLNVTNVSNLSSDSIKSENGVQNVIISEMQDLEQLKNDPCKYIEFNKHQYMLNY